MRFFLSIILTALFAFVAGFWLPWWSIALVSFVTALFIPQTAGRSFLGGFLGLFILWGILCWWINSGNRGILAKKIALILPLNGNVDLLILVTAFTGALVAGIAATTASFLRSALK